MNKIYGYARCSTNETMQDITRQIRELLSMGVEDENNIYFEYETGTTLNRPELRRMLDEVEKGDTIITTEVSRLSRSTKDLCEILEEIEAKQICLVIGSFVVDCRKPESIDPMTKGMLMMLAVFSELERDMISQRVKSGMANARDKGKRIGRPPLTRDNLPEKFYKYYLMYQEGKLTVTDLARLMECSRTTIYKYISIMNDIK